MTSPERTRPVPRDIDADTLAEEITAASAAMKSASKVLNERFITAHDRMKQGLAEINPPVDEVVHEIMIAKGEKPPAANDRE